LTLENTNVARLTNLACSMHSLNQHTYLPVQAVSEINNHYNAIGAKTRSSAIAELASVMITPVTAIDRLTLKR